MSHKNALVTVSLIAIAAVVFTSLAVAGISIGPAEAQSANTMALDMNITGNTSSAIPSIEQCARINGNGVQDADESGVDTLTVDVIIQGVPAFNDNGTPDTSDDTGGIRAYQGHLIYDSATFTVISAQVASSPPPDGTFLLNRNLSSATSDFSEPTPDDNTDNGWTGVSFDSDSRVPEGGDGVLHRLTIGTEAGAAAGQYLINFFDNVHLDASGAVFFPTTTLVSNIAVNQACGQIITPSPTTSPSPSPSPEPPTCPTPATPGGMCVMGIDTRVAGNANTVVGAIDQCARINENNTIDADEATNVDLNGDTIPDPDILLVDITAQGIAAHNDNGTPADPSDDAGGILGFQFDFEYPAAGLTVVAQSLQANSPFAPLTSIIAVNPGSSIFEASAPVPDDNVDDSWQGAVLDTGLAPPEQGDGVLQRIAIRSETGVSTGQALIALVNNVHFDVLGTPQFPVHTLVANIAVNQACSGLIIPTPSPSPSPSPMPPPVTPTPTPAPTPSRSPTQTPCPTNCPTPSVNPTPSRSPTPTVTPFPTLTPTPAQPPIPPGFHDARAARLSVSQSVDLRGNSTGKVTFTIANDGNHFETIGVYLDVIPPTDGGCLPAGRLRQTVLNLNPRDKVTLTVDGYPGDPTPGDGKVTFGCSQPLMAEGQNFTFILGVDAHGDDLSFCPPNALLSASCLARRNDDDADGTDNTRIQTAPRVVIH